MKHFGDRDKTKSRMGKG